MSEVSGRDYEAAARESAQAAIDASRAVAKARQEKQAQGKQRRAEREQLYAEQRDAAVSPAPDGTEIVVTGDDATKAAYQAIRVGALQIRKAEEKQMAERQRNAALRRNLPVAPQVKFYDRKRVDASIPLDSKGHPISLQGFVGRWVNATNHRGDPDDTRLNDVLAYDAEIVKDPYTGQELRRHGQVLVRMTAAQRAQEIWDASPRGAHDTADLLDDVYEVEQHANTGTQAPQLRVRIDEGSEIQQETYDPE